MDKELFVKILEEKLPKMRKYNNEDWQLKFDNDPKHTSKMALEYLKEKKLNVLEWPPYSPDLSPIEKIWGILAEQLNKKDINTQAELISEIENAWEQLSQLTIDNWIDFMPGRIMKCIKNEGDRINY